MCNCRNGDLSFELVAGERSDDHLVGVERISGRSVLEWMAWQVKWSVAVLKLRENWMGAERERWLDVITNARFFVG